MPNTSILKIGKRNPAIGFESTWRYKSTEEQEAFDKKSLDGHSHSTSSYIPLGVLVSRTFNKEYDKIKSFDSIQNDPFNIEIPTKKITNKNQLLSDFTKLSILMNNYGFIESSRSHNSFLEGGGHIHIDYGEIFGDLGYNNDYSYSLYSSFDLNLNYTKHNNNKQFINVVFGSFVQNITNYIINNPWIPWAFNAPNDNECAKNNLLHSNLKEDIKTIKTIGLQSTNTLLIDCKMWAITLRPELETFEFRFFGMPKHAKELDLHINLTQAIFKLCLNMTLKGIIIKPNYKTWKSLTKITLRQSINGLKSCCKELNIKYTDLDKMGKLSNLHIRYAYQEATIESEPFNERNMMLN